MDKGQLTGVIFIDLRKAFDTISHSLIVSKLPNYGISGIEKSGLQIIYLRVSSVFL